MNDADHFDMDRLSGSLQYDDDHTPPQPVITDNKKTKDKKKV
jgi:hypothetical protein